MMQIKPLWLRCAMTALTLSLLTLPAAAEDLCTFNAAGQQINPLQSPESPQPIPGWGGVGGTGITIPHHAKNQQEGWGGLGGSGLNPPPLPPGPVATQQDREGWGGLGGTGVARTPAQISAPLAGTVIIASGNTVAKQGQLPMRKLARGDAVCEGDVISTAPQHGLLQIRMADQGMVMLYADTKMQINQFRLPANIDGSERLTLSLQQGGMRARTGEIGHLHKENYLITTPVAQIHVRGTDHEIYHVPVSTGRFAGVPSGTYNHVFQGGTTLSNLHGALRLEPSQSGYASLSQESPAILDVLPTELGRIKVNLRFDVTEENTDKTVALTELPDVLTSNGFGPSLDSETVSASAQTAYVGVSSSASGSQVSGFNGNLDDVNQLELDPDSQLPRAFYLPDGTLMFYATEDTALVEYGQALVDGAQVVWGVYDGGVAADRSGDWQSIDFHHFALSQDGATPLSILEHPSGPINVSYSTIVGSTTPTSEFGVMGGQLNSLSVGLQLGANPSVTSYAINVTDGNQRNWNASFSGSVPLADFKSGLLPLSGSCSSPNCGASSASGQASGVVIGNNGKGLITGYGLQTPLGETVSGVAVLARP